MELPSPFSSSDPETRRALRAVRGGYRPNKVVACAAGEVPGVPLLAGKAARGPVTTYICQNYACLIDALVSLYEADFDPRWLKTATELADDLVARFYDPAAAGFFFTSTDHEELLTRSQDVHDGSTPSGNSTAAAAAPRWPGAANWPEAISNSSGRTTSAGTA